MGVGMKRRIVPPLLFSLLAVMACGSAVTAPITCEPRFSDVGADLEGPPSLAELPADSIVSALVAGPFGGMDRAVKRQWLEARGIEVLHVFHFQPWILIATTGEQLRALAAEPGVEFRIGWARVTGGGC